MRRIVKRMPNAQGVIVDADDIPDAISTGRIDIDMSRWIQGEDSDWRNEWFSVQAPGNLEWSTVWFTFELRSESYTSPITGERERFDPSAFLGEHEEAYLSFFRDRAVCSFLSSLMKGYEFRSSSSVP
jgi:hypothetical protein